MKKESNSKKHKSLTMWDYLLKFKEKPLIKVLDEDLVFGSNMWPKLLQEEQKTVENIPNTTTLKAMKEAEEFSKNKDKVFQ
ncbi:MULTISPECIES: hypothetical protein [Capnocytophaga]|jgi:hypothetical protein|uniref:hypothetical protein n=1 Tax=Capnocytophaga TaxID=1016 RepID=UPI0002FE5CFF|nr:MULTISPECIES: hypothetical protein [Capnocytophaga]